MPKAKKDISQDEQSKRFLEEVERMIGAGELSPTEAERRFEEAVRRIMPPDGRPRPSEPPE
jgi:hypothetical protein